MSINNEPPKASQAQSDGWFRRKGVVILLLLFALITASLLVLVIVETNDSIRWTIQGGNQSIIDHIAPAIVSAVDIINRNTQCDSHFSVIDPKQIVSDVGTAAKLTLRDETAEVKKRLIDVVPFEYIDGKLTKVMLVYEGCQLPKLSCRGWDCTPQLNQDE